MPIVISDHLLWATCAVKCIVTVTDPWQRQVEFYVSATLQPVGLSSARVWPKTETEGIRGWIADKLLETLLTLRRDDPTQVLAPYRIPKKPYETNVQFSTRECGTIEALITALHAWCTVLGSSLGTVESIQRETLARVELCFSQGRNLQEYIDALLDGSLDKEVTP
ncbi:hypothetical protein HY375_02875 [Candidatus Berkelbacteria bacterium]|nr:hypothetical protein [Candidatus Berkelbacteria bacterium]